MNDPDQMIFPDSPEAATYRTDIKGWVSRKGLFFGGDEHLARMNGCTHVRCEECDEPAETHHRYCAKCAAKRRFEKFMALPAKEWDGSVPLCLYQGDVYFYDSDEIEEYCDEHDIHPEDPEELQLVWCMRQQPPVFAEDYFADWLDCEPEIETPKGILDAIDEFNEKIKEHFPVMWIPDNVRAII